MFKSLLYLLPLAAVLALGSWQNSPTPKVQESTIQADTTFDMQKALADLREQIKGKENLPSDSVFQNIKMLKKVPAGRLLRIMEMGYCNSLGVTCTHCHNSADWASEEKPQKQITRDMAAMVGKINNELLKGIPNLKSDNPTVNCTTCHRGEVKPALNMPAKN